MPVSVVIPCFNAARHLRRLLGSVTDDPHFSDGDEVIVVDDRSTDDTAAMAHACGVRVVELPQNSGPSVARNRGVKEATNELILFLDSDTVLERGSLAAVKEFFSSPEATRVCVNGICSKVALRSSPARDYKALVEYSWHLDGFRDRGALTCFNTRVGAIRKQLFDEVGWFNPVYTKALVEDYEFGYRVSERYQIVSDDRIQVRHDFPGFVGTLKAYATRSRLWAELFVGRGAFDGSGTSGSNALGHIFGALIPVVLALAVWNDALIWVLLVTCGGFAWVFRTFILLVLRERGAAFLLYCVALHLIYSMVIVGFAAIGLLRGLLNAAPASRCRVSGTDP